MKIKFGLTAKITISVIVIGLLLTTAQSVLFYIDMTQLYEKNFQEKYEIYTTTLDSIFDQYFKDKENFDELDSNYFFTEAENLSNTLKEIVESFMSINPFIINVNIVMTNTDGSLFIFVSSDNDSTNNPPSYENLDAYSIKTDTIITKKNETSKEYTLISPIHIYQGDEVWRIGAYELKVTVKNDYEDMLSKIQSNILSSFIIIVVFVVLSLYFIRKLLITPLLKIVKKTRKFGKGKLDTRIIIKSRDELSELANAFNQMAKDIKEYNRILESLLDQKDEFIGQLGHDLKNPMQPLVGLLPMLIEKEKDPSIKEALEVMNNNVEYMQDLIFKTLELAKLRSIDIKFEIEDLDLKKESEKVINSQKLYLEENNVSVENKISEDIVVKADKLRLIEVFKNLISNSVKYKKEGKGKIVIDAKIDKNFVTVSVSDNGIGMTKDQLRKVFDEFYKADAFSNEIKSSGLGLSICKRIIEKLGGKVWVESKGPGKGSTFYFTLKLSKGIKDAG